MKPLLVLTLSFCFTISAFGQQPEYPDSGFTNKAEAKNLMVNGLKEGKWVEYLTDYYSVIKDTNTEKYSYYQLCVYKADKLNDILKIYNNGGKLEEQRTYNNGQKNGQARDYYMSGQLMWEGTYKNNVLNGVIRSYYKNGKIKSEASYLNGKEDGLEKHYFENGEINYEIPFRKGKAQDSLSERDYSFYHFLIKFVITQYGLDSVGKDKCLGPYKLGGYTIKIMDSTGINLSPVHTNDIDSTVTLQDYWDYNNINKAKYLINKKRLGTHDLVKLQKDKKPITTRLEFGKPYFFNDNNNVIVYMGVVFGPLNGSGYLYVFQKTNDSWRVLKKIFLWVS